MQTGDFASRIQRAADSIGGDDNAVRNGRIIARDLDGNEYNIAQVSVDFDSQADGAPVTCIEIR